MRVLLFCTVVIGALETAPLWSFSGNFSTTTSFNGAYLSSSDGSCSLSSSYYYQSVNYTFPTAGVRTINTYNIDYVGVTKNAYNLTNLCNSSVPLLRGSSKLSYLYPFGHYFDANVSYTFILGGSSGEQFVAEVWNGIQGQTALGAAGAKGNKTWYPLTSSSGDCYQQSTLQLYDTQVMTINATGVYHVFLAFVQDLALVPNSIPYGGPSFAIIQGDVSGVNLLTVDCTNVTWVTASAVDGNVNSQSYFVSLTGNQTYTFVISSGYFYATQFYYGHYGLTVAPATRLSFSSISTWKAPTTSSCGISGPACTSSTRQALPYGIANFKVPATSMFYVAASENQDQFGKPASVDLRFFLFRGVNTGPLTCGGLSTCIDTEDSLGYSLFTAGSTEDYTLIVQNYNDDYAWGANASSNLYVMSGLQIGLTTVTNAPTSNAPSNAPTTVAPSSMLNTTNAPSSMLTSRQPTVQGYTYAPTTVAPTPVGYTYAPSTAKPTVKPQDAVNSGGRLHPGLFVVALGVVAFGWM